MNNVLNSFSEENILNFISDANKLKKVKLNELKKYFNDLVILYQKKDENLKTLESIQKDSISALQTSYNKILEECKNEFQKEKQFMQQQNENNKQFSNKELIISFLEILDNLEVINEELNNNNIKGCIDRIYNILSSYHTQVLEVKPGDDFDSSLHVALFTEKIENEKKGKIVKILRRGFMMRDIVIRCALVSVTE